MSDYKLSRLVAAIKKFNEGDYFECHEILEDIWFEVRDNSRNFYQGLLHVSVAFYHLTKRNNFKGTIIQITKAIDKLGGYNELYLGIDLVKLKGQLKRMLIKLKKKEVPKRLPKIIMQ
jgi:predicted metal-dependent hydrolase